MRSGSSARVWLTAAVAAAVPIVWCALLLDLASDWPLCAAMVVTSVVFWSLAARGFVRARSHSSALLAALGLGAASPLLCAALMEILLLPFWPFILLTGPTMGWVPATPFFTLMFVVYAWEVFFPVGAGMGLVAFVIARARAPTRMGERPVLGA